MAKDLMRMLTEITPTQQPVAGTPNFRGMFGQQQAQRLQGSLGSLARGGVPSAQARMGQALAGLDLNKPEDLAKLAKIQQGTGDFAGAAQTAAKIEALRTQEAQATSGEKQRQQLAIYLDKTYPGQGYGALALQGTITPANMKNFIPGIDDSGFTKGPVTLGKDTNDNIYQISTAFSTSSGGLETKYAPYSPNAPAKPEGKVTPIATQSGMTLGEELGLRAQAKGVEKEATDFSGMKSTAVDEISDTNEALYIGQNALELLDKIQTGGLTTDLTKRITDVFGVTPTSVTSFQNQVGQLMLKKLKLFGANPTEGERAALAELGAELKKGKGANKAIIERFVREQLRRKERLQFLTRKDTDNLQDYLDFVNSQYVSDVEPGTSDGGVINFSDLAK
jgi:hypothetical protein